MKIHQSNLKELSKKTLFEYEKLFPVLKKEKNRQYGMLALTFFTMTIFGIFAVNPTITTIVELQKKLGDARFVESRLSQKLSNLQTLKQKYDFLFSDLILVERAVPQKPEPIKFIGQIQAVALTSGVTVSNIQTGSVVLTGQEASEEPTRTPEGAVPQTEEALPEIVEPEAQMYEYTLTINGPYSQIRSFLTEITHFDRLTTINAVSISRESTESQSVTLTVQGATFYKN